VSLGFYELLFVSQRDEKIGKYSINNMADTNIQSGDFQREVSFRLE
jgi:hypothetical protein